MVLCGGMMLLGVGTVLWLGYTTKPDPYPTPLPPQPQVLVPPTLSGPGPDGIAGAIGALSQKGGSSEWDTAVKPILLGAYDLNGSGQIDNTPEVESIPCETWQALDRGVQEGWDYGLRTIYGLEADYSWVGGALGLSESVRVTADAKLVACLAGIVPATGVPSGGGVAGSIRRIPHEGGGSAWDNAAELIMTAAYDSNHNGRIDTSAELAGIPCEVWKALDDGVHVKWDYGLRTIYGFDGVAYLGRELGFSDSMQPLGETAIIGCGIGE
jgi:hypothetical protein